MTHIFFGVKVFLTIFCIYVNFALICHILNLYKVIQRKFIKKYVFVSSHRQKIGPHFSTLKVQYFVFEKYGANF
jgi:hypothetical protein